ncbi:MAG: IS1595 family transposase [Hyphomicrobiaceae bacterium]
MKVTKLEGEKHRPGVHQCKACREQFTVTVGTIMERSHIPLAKWVLAIQLMAASKKGMSAKQIERMLGVTYRTAWFMMHRIRKAMSPDEKAGPLGGTGRPSSLTRPTSAVAPRTQRRASRSQRSTQSWRSSSATVRCAPHVPDVTARTVREVLVRQVSRKSTLMTDDSLLYHWLGREFANHEAVNHSAKEYVRDAAHVNTAESFFSLLKRGIMGSFHSVSEQHLQRYADEFAFRWNHRKVDDATRAAAIIRAADGKRLTYRRID